MISSNAFTQALMVDRTPKYRNESLNPLETMVWKNSNPSNVLTLGYGRFERLGILENEWQKVNPEAVSLTLHYLNYLNSISEAINSWGFFKTLHL